MLNWRLPSPHTQRACQQAIRDFESVTGTPAAQADATSLAIWQASMDARKLSANTIRARLSVVAKRSGVKVQLPKKVKAQPVILSDDQVQAFFRQVEKDSDRDLLVAIFLTGYPTRMHAHWLAPYATVPTTQEITRKIKRYAGLAGIDPEQMNLRAFVRTGRQLADKYSPEHITEHLLVRPVEPTVAWKPLHGIGRRSRRTIKI